MEYGQHIKFLPYADIDKTQWDACIDAAGKPIYGYSFYLDHMARQWDALVLLNNDFPERYDAVMPLTWNRKMGITYLYQPFLTPQGGVFAQRATDEMVQAFLFELKSRYRFAEINLNTGNPLPTVLQGMTKHDCYRLSLTEEFDVLSSRFNNNLVRNCRKAIATGCVYKEGISLDSMLALAEGQLKQYTRLLKDDLHRFRELCEYLLEKGSATAVGVYKEDKLLASCIFFYSGKTAYYILAGNHPEGKAIGASHFLLQEYIRERAGTDLILDFVGSDFSSIAFFYGCFGAVAEHYYSFRFNRLPKTIRWLKK